MGVGVQGKEKLVKIDISGTMTEVDHQGDATFNTGKTGNISAQKNSKLPFQTEAGATVTFTIKKERPMLAAHTALIAAGSTGAIIAAEYADYTTGGESHSGDVQVTMGEESTGVEGLLEQGVTLSFVDDPVAGVTA